MVWPLPPIMLVLSVAAAKARSRLPKTMPAAIAFTYAAVLGGICLDPCFRDNGPPEYIAWRDRRTPAAESSGWLSAMTAPAVSMLVASIRDALGGRRRDG
ncbi:MAG: hypothetical protein ABW173_03910 [Sphingomonas sp.]